MTEFSLLTDTGNGRTGRYRDGGENIRRYGKEAEQGNETVIDAYCGTGTISLDLAQKAKHVIGIEIIPAAIENAQKNAEKNHVKNVEFHAADAADYLSQAAKKGKSADIIVLDPIRAGCSEKVLSLIHI